AATFSKKLVRQSRIFSLSSQPLFRVFGVLRGHLKRLRGPSLASFLRVLLSSETESLPRNPIRRHRKQLPRQPHRRTAEILLHLPPHLHKQIRILRVKRQQRIPRRNRRVK